MSSALGAVGVSGGYAHNSSTTDKTENQNTAATGTNQTSGASTPTYSQDQAGLQGTLAQAIQAILSGTGYSPQVNALQTASADSINKNASGVGDRMNRFLASRGFGQSGKVGQSQLQTELGRQGNLAANNANFAGMALNQFTTGLADALNFAFANPGSSTSSTGTTTANQNTTDNSTTNSSGSSYGVGVGGGLSGRI